MAERKERFLLAPRERKWEEAQKKRRGVTQMCWGHSRIPSPVFLPDTTPLILGISICVERREGGAKRFQEPDWPPQRHAKRNVHDCRLHLKMQRWNWYISIYIFLMIYFYGKPVCNESGYRNYVNTYDNSLTNNTMDINLILRKFGTDTCKILK